MKITVFLDAELFSIVEINIHYFLHNQGDEHHWIVGQIVPDHTEQHYRRQVIFTLVAVRT
jgi:hypothetical protein